MYDIASYCFRSSQCDSFDIYVYNLGINFFPIVLNLMQIIETLIAYWKTKDDHTTRLKYQMLGKLLAEIFKNLVDFHAQRTVVFEDILSTLS